MMIYCYYCHVIFRESVSILHCVLEMSICHVSPFLIDQFIGHPSRDEHCLGVPVAHIRLINQNYSMHRSPLFSIPTESLNCCNIPALLPCSSNLRFANHNCSLQGPDIDWLWSVCVNSLSSKATDPETLANIEFEKYFWAIGYVLF